MIFESVHRSFIVVVVGTSKKKRIEEEKEKKKKETPTTMTFNSKQQQQQSSSSSSSSSSSLSMPGDRGILLSLVFCFLQARRQCSSTHRDKEQHDVLCHAWKDLERNEENERQREEKDRDPITRVFLTCFLSLSLPLSLAVAKVIISPC